MDNNRVIDLMDGLRETCIDGARRLRTRAMQCESVELKSLFLATAIDGEQAGEELREVILDCGGALENKGAAMHGGWASGIATIADDDERLLEECELWQDAALTRYREALEEPVPENIATLLRRHYDGVKRSCDQISERRERAGVRAS